MRTKISGLTIGAVILICLAVGLFFLISEKETQKVELKLSDFPETFKENTVIVIGENASQIEKESAEAIAANLENVTGNKPNIYISKEIGSLKYIYNLVIIGTPDSNKVLGEVYNMANAIRVTEEYPCQGKGILEILRNPWNEDKAMLLVGGSDEWGLAITSEKFESAVQLDKRREIFEIEKNTFVTGRVAVVGNEPFSVLVIKGKGDKNSYFVARGDQKELWKLQGNTLRIEGYMTKYIPNTINVIDYEILNDSNSSKEEVNIK